MNEYEQMLFDKKLEEAKAKINKTDSGIVDIKGKEYSTVGNRLNAIRESFGLRISIKTTIIERSDNRVCMKAEIFYNDAENNKISLSDGYAEKNRDDSFITKTSCVEFCQTTAVGRALAMLGLLGNNEIASANEMSISDNKEKKIEQPKQQPTNQSKGGLI